MSTPRYLTHTDINLVALSWKHVMRISDSSEEVLKLSGSMKIVETQIPIREKAEKSKEKQRGRILEIDSCFDCFDPVVTLR